MREVIWEKGTKVLCVDDKGVGGDLKKGMTYTVAADFTRHCYSVWLKTMEMRHGFYTHRFIKCEDLSLEEAIKAMMDGHKVRRSTWDEGDYAFWDGTGSYFRDENGKILSLTDVTRSYTPDTSFSIVTKKNTTIILANGKKVELSEESYDKLVEVAK